MPRKYTMEVSRSAGSKESTAVSSKLRDDILRKHFGYEDADIVEVNLKYAGKHMINFTGDPDKLTTDYEWEKIYIPKFGTKILVTLDDNFIRIFTDFLNNRRMTFIEIEASPGNPIGQIGFLGNKAVIIVAYYDDYDTDQDGKVGWGEWFASFADMGGMLKNDQVVRVAMTARLNPKVLKIDGGFYQKANNIYLSFAAGLLIGGAYEAYLSKAVGSAASAAGKRIIGDSLTRRFLVEKGAEQAVGEALKLLYQ